MVESANADRPVYPHSWMPVLRAARASVGVLVLCAVGLLLPPQTRDMMAALADDGVWPIVAFHFALIFLAFSAWYWARAATSAEWRIGDEPKQRLAAYRAGCVHPAAFEWLPRALFGTVGFIGLLLLFSSWSVINGVVVIVWIMLGWLFLVKRTAWFGRTSDAAAAQLRAVGVSPTAVWPLRQWRRIAERVSRLTAYAPFGRRFALILLVAALVPFVSGALGVSITLPAWWPLAPANVAAAFPGAAAAVLGLGLMIGPLTAITFIADGWTPQFNLRGLMLGPRKPPVLTVLSLWVFVAAPLLSHVHMLRVATGSLSPDRRTTLSPYFREWATKCFPVASAAGPVRPVIVALSGGATKAGLWAARVLYDIEDATGQGGPAIFAISSVSGGSLGAAAYLALDAGMIARDGRAFCEVPPAANRSSGLGLDFLATPNGLYADALGPTLAAWLLSDIPRAMLAVAMPRTRGRDSAEAIERAFERLWSPIADQARHTPTFDQPLLSVFYTKAGFDQALDKSVRGNASATAPGLPLWIGNGTEVTTGNRILTTPIQPGDNKSDWPFRSALDLLGLLRADVPISTAINNTARFPILEPFGDILPDDAQNTQAEVIDGGYFENEGLQTALELAAWLRTEGSKALAGRAVEPIVIEVTADADPGVKRGDIVRCATLSDGPATPTGRTHMDLQVLAPVLGVYNIRGGHSRALLFAARDFFCNGEQRFFHFYLPGDGPTPIPLNWVLSRNIAHRIWSATDNVPLGNRDELSAMRATLKRWTPGT